MADFGVVGAVVPLVSAVIGGGLTLAGQWVLQGRQTEAAKKKQRADKFEELVALLYEHQYWLKTVREIRAFNRADVEPPSPFAKAIAISAAYFPQFNNAILALDVAAGEYEVWMLEQRQKRMNGSLEIVPGELEAYRIYGVKLVGLTSDLKEFAKKELQ